MRTRDQEYAAQVFTRVLNFAEREGNNGKLRRYNSLAHGLPVLIRSAGLVQALAFALRKQENVALLDDLAATLGVSSGAALLQQSAAAELHDYMLLTDEVLAALLWFKRGVQSILQIDPSQQED